MSRWYGVLDASRQAVPGTGFASVMRFLTPKCAWRLPHPRKCLRRLLACVAQARMPSLLSPATGQWPRSNQIRCRLMSVSHWAQPGNKRALLQLPASKLTAFQKTKKLRQICQMLISPSPALAMRSSFGIMLGEKGRLISFQHRQAHARDGAHLAKKSKAELHYFNIK